MAEPKTVDVAAFKKMLAEKKVVFPKASTLHSEIAQFEALNRAVDRVHPADVFDQMTRDGFKFNLITGIYSKP